MYDDFFDDNFEDSLFDPDNDFEEDVVDDAGGEWYEDDDILADERAADYSSAGSNCKQDCFDFADACIFGSMIYGNAYEENLDNKKRKQLVEEGKNKKD